MISRVARNNYVVTTRKIYKRVDVQRSAIRADFDGSKSNILELTKEEKNTQGEQIRSILQAPQNSHY
jgi:hypothetical protein